MFELHCEGITTRLHVFRYYKIFKVVAKFNAFNIISNIAAVFKAEFNVKYSVIIYH
jgi:hypothetical protein